MKKTLEELLKEYSQEVVVGRILEQLKLLIFSKDEEVIRTVKEAFKDAGCDTEYIYMLCEYSNLTSYASEEVNVTSSPWIEG